MSWEFKHTQQRLQVGSVDRRYRLSIMLVAEKRPRYWDFHCPKCGQKIGELSGIMISISDVSDLNALPDYQPAPMNVECKGKFCRIWFEFITLSGHE
ncbi:MAG: hypothetical protein H0X02_05740 [Nitrosomonas sp.]|nr:hypothetical protein [Nitrosomonas sp.]